MKTYPNAVPHFVLHLAVLFFTTWVMHRSVFLLMNTSRMSKDSTIFSLKNATTVSAATRLVVDTIDHSVNCFTHMKRNRFLFKMWGWAGKSFGQKPETSCFGVLTKKFCYFVQSASVDKYELL